MKIFSEFRTYQLPEDYEAENVVIQYQDSIANQIANVSKLIQADSWLNFQYCHKTLFDGVKHNFSQYDRERGKNTLSRWISYQNSRGVYLCKDIFLDTMTFI